MPLAPSPSTLHSTGPAALLTLALVGCAGADDHGASGATSGEPSTSSTADASTTSTTSTTDASSTASATSDATTSTSTAAETSDETTGAALWRSELYPAEWDPDHEDDEGRFLHDFSYAGYHHGEAALGEGAPLELFDVIDFGADPSGQVDARAAFQAAIDAATAAGGGVVEVPAGLFRLDDQLSITASDIVLRGVGAEQSRLWFTRFAGMSNRAHVELTGALVHEEDRLLVADAEARARELRIDDASGLEVGDDLVIGWTITDEFIAEHGMTGVWIAFNGQWQPFFWRTVVAVDTGVTPHRVTIDVPLRYPAKLRDQARLHRVTGALREVGVEDLGIADAVGWDDAWSESQVHGIALDGVVDAWIRGVASFPSPGAPTEGLGAGRHLQSGGVMVRYGKRVTIADTDLALAENRGGGGNGYLFEVRQSSEVLIRDCVGEAGRHNFIQNWGFGATGIVWLRVRSKDGRAVAFQGSDLGLVGFSEFHHSLATANLIDQSVIDDGWGAVNRGDESTGAGHAATQSVLWNPSGTGTLRSRQYGHGYVIGPAPSLVLETDLAPADAAGTAPEDWVEGPGKIGALDPPSLYEDQLARRLGG